MATSKLNIKFDKLDKKCIQELPLMVDVIASTFNKIKLLYDPFYEDLKEVIKKELKKKNKWHLSPRDLGMIFYPFTSDEMTNNKKISSLDHYFSLWGQFNIYSGEYAYNKRKASFGVYLATEYNIKEEFPFPCSYFQIENWDLKRFGNIYKQSFYSSLCASIKYKQLEIDYSHPYLDIDNESIWVSCKTLDTDQITIAYEIFKDKILIPFIRQLK